jgi:phage terminase large subunit-like protein
MLQTRTPPLVILALLASIAVMLVLTRDAQASPMADTSDQRSLVERLAAMPPDARAAALADFTDHELAELEYLWPAHARPKQLAPAGAWRTWLVMAGRGFGKTRIGAEWIREKAEANPRGRFALVARTAPDARDVMVEGESGILAISPPSFRPKYEPSKRRLTWPNGAVATTFSADEPDLLRGPQHHAAWADELAAWRYDDAWDQLQFGLRLGTDPRAVVTTTPRPTKLVRSILSDPTTAVTRGSMFENRSNLPPAFIEKIVRKYGGTRLGRQEIEAEMLDDVPGALWKRADLDLRRVRQAPELRRVVVAIDPAVSADEESDETGIVIAGAGTCRCNRGVPELHGFVLDDRSGRKHPAEWAKDAVSAYQRHKADRIVAEVNQGGDLVEHTVRTVSNAVSYRAVHAAKGKRTRAEPVAALYEQGKVHHVGTFASLEDQMATWDPLLDDKSPDRVDALVYALTDLLIEGSAPGFAGLPGSISARRT